jgi:hypothetical protein
MRAHVKLFTLPLNLERAFQYSAMAMSEGDRAVVHSPQVDASLQYANPHAPRLNVN